MPRWRRDGGELFYRAPDGRLRAARVQGAGPSEVALPFEHRGNEKLPVNVPMARNIQYFLYAPSADGQRFLVAVPVDAARSPTTIALSWQATLTDR
jgi:hypothetical protein